MEWLKLEPAVEELRGKKWQTTEDGRVHRWHFGWSVKHKRNWTKRLRVTYKRWLGNARSGKRRSCPGAIRCGLPDLRLGCSSMENHDEIQCYQ